MVCIYRLRSVKTRKPLGKITPYQQGRTGEGVAGFMVNREANMPGHVRRHTPTVEQVEIAAFILFALLVWTAFTSLLFK
jgi:hypothetical protein